MTDAKRTESFTLDEALSIIKNTGLSRGAVETSTPEQIAWLTAEVIARNFTDARLTAVPERWRVDSAARRAIKRAGLAPKAEAKVLAILNQELSEWPS